MAAEQGVRQPGTYHAYDAMVALLRAWAQAHPLICELESIGASPEGRELWLLTLTDRRTGGHETKPGFWCEANTHAGEVTGTEAALKQADGILARCAPPHPAQAAWGGAGSALSRSRPACLPAALEPARGAAAADVWL